MEKEIKVPELRENKMRSMPVGRLLLNMAVPLAISMLVQAMYNVVDSIYVAGYSENAVTALSLAFPVQNLQIGCACGVAVGANSLLSKSLGEKNQKRASLAAGNGVILALIFAVAFAAFGFLWADDYYAIQDIRPETAAAGTAYTRIYSIFGLGMFIQILGERLLQASGRSVFSMLSQAAGAVINIILDPLFIYGFEPLGIPEMGTAGAAVATVIGQWAGAVLVIVLNLKCNKDVKFRLEGFAPKGKILGKILAVGIPTAVMMAVGSVMNFGMNQILLGFPQVGETASGVFGIYFKLQSFFFMPLFGISDACISIIAYNYGARLPHRITATLKRAVGVALVIMAMGTAVFQLLPRQLMGIFASSGNMDSGNFVAIGVSALRAISVAFPLAAIGISLGASFPALGNGIYSTITSLCRQLVVLLPAAYLLSLAGEVALVWWSFPIAEVFSVAVTVLLFWNIYRKKIHPLFQLQPETENLA